MDNQVNPLLLKVRSEVSAKIKRTFRPCKISRPEFEYLFQIRAQEVLLERKDQSFNFVIDDNNRNEIGQLSTEKSLIAYTKITAPQSRLLSTGRLRERRSVGGWAVKEDFDQLESDYETFAKRKAEFHDGTVINPAIIEELSAVRQKGTDLVFYEITFLEV